MSTSSSPLLRPTWLTSDVWPWDIKTVVAPSGRVAVTDTGTGPTLLFVHVGMWSFVWRDLMRRLEGEFRCVTLDAPANGLSDVPSGAPTTLQTAATAIRAVVDTMRLDDVTLVVHDLGGPAGIAAMADTPERVAGIAAVNTFAWRPSGALFRGMLRLAASSPVRESSAATRWLHAATSTRFGAGKNWTRTTRRTFRAAFDAERRRSTHRYLGDALHADDLFALTETALTGVFADTPVMTIFGQRNDPLRLQRRWKDAFPHAVQHVVPHGNHFPMCDAPDSVAAWIRAWHTTRIRPGSS